MRILHAYPEFLSKGGRPHDCRQMISNLSRAGHETCAVGVSRPEAHGHVMPDQNVSVRLVKHSIFDRGAFASILEDFKPDIVHFSGGPRIPIQNHWARQTQRAGIPYVVSACGNLSDPTYHHRWGNKPNHFYHPWLKRLYFAAFDSALIRNAAFVHTTSNNEAAIARVFGAQSTRIIPFGMDTAWIRKTPRIVDVQSRPMIFSYLGRLSTIHKGLDVIVDAFGILQARGFGDRVKLILAGTTENGSMDLLRTRAEKLGVTAEFPGGVWADDKEALWNKTHYFLHMCRFNGFALAAREALGQGIPTIATMESDFGDWVNEYEMGDVVEISAAALASKIESLLHDSVDYAKKVHGVQRYCQDTSWVNIASQLENAYDEILQLESHNTLMNSRAANKMSASG